MIDPESFSSTKLKQRTKERLEALQDQIRQEQGLRVRPSLSEVVEDLLALRDSHSSGEEHTQVQRYTGPHAGLHYLLDEIMYSDAEEIKDAIIRNLKAFALSTRGAYVIPAEKRDAFLDEIMAGRKVGDISDLNPTKHRKPKRAS